MKANIVADIAPPIPYLLILHHNHHQFQFLNYIPRCRQPIFKKNTKDEVDFLAADKQESFL